MLRLFRRDPPPVREAEFIDVSHGGEIYRIRVRRTATAKRFTLRVRAAARDIVLTMPARASFKAGKSFAERQGAWIGAKLRHLPEKIGFEPGDSVPLRGVLHRSVTRRVCPNRARSSPRRRVQIAANQFCGCAETRPSRRGGCRTF